LYATVWEIRNTHEILVGKSLRKRPLSKEDKIKMLLEEMAGTGLGSCKLASFDLTLLNLQVLLSNEKSKLHKNREHKFSVWIESDSL